MSEVNSSKLNSSGLSITEGQCLIEVDLLEDEIDNDNLIDASPLPTRLTSSPDVFIISAEEATEESDCKESDYTRSYKRRWDTCSRSIIPRLASSEETSDETESLINNKGSSDSNNTSFMASVNSCFNTCSGFKTTLIILGALVAFSAGGYVCKRINDLHHETPFEDGNHKQSWYFILGLGALLMFGAGIGLAYWSVHRIYGSFQVRTTLGFTRRESQYEEI